MTPAAPPRRLDWDEAGRRVVGLRAEYARNRARFDRLAADPAYLTLPRSTGRTTSARWRLAAEEMDAAGSLLALWDETLTTVERKLAGRPHRSELTEIERLLEGDAFTLKPTEMPRQLRPRPGGKSTEPRFSLAMIGERVESNLRAVAKLVADVARNRAAAEHLAAMLNAIGDDADAADGVPLRRAVGDIADLARTDPIAIRMDEVEALEVELTRIRCGQLTVAVDGLEAMEIHERARIVGLGVAARVPHAAVGLHRRIRALEGRRADLATLDGLANDIATAIRAVRGDEPPMASRGEQPAALPHRARTCARPDCPGGGLAELDEDGICETCFRAAPRVRREAS